MPYCTLDDVQGLIVNFEITDTSPVTISMVNNEIIPDVDQKIDERLGKYYVTPIIGTNALKTINRIAKWYAAAYVLERTYLQQAPSDSNQATVWKKDADADLNNIVTGAIILFDAVATDDTPELVSKQISDKLSQPSYPTGSQFSMDKVF